MQVQEKGFSLNYVGQARPRFWSLFLCASVVGSGSLFTPDAKGYREFAIQVHPYYIARSLFFSRSKYARYGSFGQFQLLNDGAEKEQYIPKHKERNSESANHLLWCGSSDEQENEHYCQDR